MRATGVPLVPPASPPADPPPTRPGRGRLVAGVSVALVLALVAVAIAAGLSLSTAHAQISDNMIKIGVLSDMSSLYTDLAGAGSVVAARMAVVSTQIGAQGLDVQDGEQLRLADTEEGFARAVIELLRDPAQREVLGARAAGYVARHYDWSVIAPRLSAVYDSVLGTASAPERSSAR